MSKLTESNSDQEREISLKYHRYLVEELSLDIKEVWVGEYLKDKNNN